MQCRAVGAAHCLVQATRTASAKSVAELPCPQAHAPRYVRSPVSFRGGFFGSQRAEGKLQGDAAGLKQSPDHALHFGSGKRWRVDSGGQHNGCSVGFALDRQPASRSQLRGRRNAQDPSRTCPMCAAQPPSTSESRWCYRSAATSVDRAEHGAMLACVMAHRQQRFPPETTQLPPISNYRTAAFAESYTGRPWRPGGALCRPSLSS